MTTMTDDKGVFANFSKELLLDGVSPRAPERRRHALDREARQRHLLLARRLAQLRDIRAEAQ